MTEIFYSGLPSHLKNVYVPAASIAYSDKPCETSGRMYHDVVKRGSLSRMRSRLNGQITTRTETRKLQSLRCPYRKEERDIVKRQNVYVPPSRRYIRKKISYGRRNEVARSPCAPSRPAKRAYASAAQ
jgi:hypothetical protein